MIFHAISSDINCVEFRVFRSILQFPHRYVAAQIERIS